MENTEESFGKLIKHLRKERKISLHELSVITQLSEAYLCRLESEERRNPTIDAINRLKYALNIDISVIERVFPFPEGENKSEKQIQSIEDLLLNTYSFAGQLASIEVQFCLRQIIKEFEMYALKETCDRDEESNILKLADNLRKEVKVSITKKVE